ncbi:mitochondrial 54S ribosomal protein mL46 Ecym_1106 [Eremothecium cymbalariae DBVPG|uniref:Large ribosomal subunit protein mL46 n=1 Tax=Eremothecium cymbalariae (strain CBS 270.75 / DBVPG 7215 / KCTC 17166 / NRRL Y-17582) TaxID=931890 RepID=G8JMK6_ERECY|nr:hypothetical protein Ecym_1106 [Eremothecium cymbalariae DBVPG\
MGNPSMTTIANKGVPLVQSIKAGLILSRIPIVTAELTKLESQYYKYQSELERRLMWTFPQYFYFKRGTLAERRFLDVQKGVVSKQPGVWFPQGVPDVRHNRERSRKQDILLPKQVSEGRDDSKMSREIVPNSRTTNADEANDIKSLERKLDRTLYLLLKDQQDRWRFPSFSVSAAAESGVRSLHVAAENGLKASSDSKINTWTVSTTPAAALRDGEVTEFLIKSHILAGEFKLPEKKPYKEFAWLTKEEIEAHTDPEYFAKIDFLLANI